MTYQHLRACLKVKRKAKGDHPIVVYGRDKNGYPIPDPRKILLIYARGRDNCGGLTLAFDADCDFGVDRYEVFVDKYKEFKPMIDKKRNTMESESDLESRAKGGPD